MTYNLCFDYCSIVVLAVLIFFYFVTPKYKSFQNRLFGVVIVCNLLACIFDVLSAGLFIPKYPDELILNRILLVIYQLSQHALSPLYYVYMIFLIHTDSAKEKLKKRTVLLLPGIIDEILNLLSLFFPIAFIFDENGYARTGFFFYSWSVVAFYMILCLVTILKYKSRTGFLPKIAVVFYTATSILSAWIQYRYPEVLIIGFASCITVFTMYMALQSPVLLKEALEDAEKSKKIAEEASEAKSNFLANMSHEIRTPMNAICGMTYLLESFDLKSDARDYITTIQSASENLLSLINGILDYSKVDAGKMSITETEYHVDAMIREIGGMVLSSVDPERVAATLYIDKSVPSVMKGDVTKVKQIVFNLLNNAIKFTEDGEILLSLSFEPVDEGRGNLIIRVSDTGIGIKEEDIPKIFKQFEQIDMAKTRRREGTGLGLTLVNGYCELMNGHVEVKSNFGEGSVFTAVIEQKAVLMLSEQRIDRLKDYVYVVLEDNPYSRRAIEHTLSNIGVEYSCENRLSTVPFEKFEKEKFCLIFDYSSFGSEVDATDLSQYKQLKKIALTDFTFRVPEDTKDLHFSRVPFSVITLLDSLSVVEEKTKEEEERLYFKSSVKVAVVDDNKVNLTVTKAILKKYGITATTLLSGYAILDELDSGEQYDLIFMDHMMPDLDGVETVRRIRAMHKGNTGNVPIIALTANAVEGAREEYLKSGMNDALFKPVNVDALKEVLVKWIPPAMRVDAPD